jgi:uncharacterized DUF497 family protein
VLIEFDPAKDAANIQKHGMSLAVAGELTYALTAPAKTVRGERRVKLIGEVSVGLISVIATWRAPRLRIISVRRANRKERKHYDAEVR